MARAPRRVVQALMRHEHPEQKVSKQEANYGPGKPSAHCGICEHFEAPDACEIVHGKIAPHMWCEYFEKDD